MKASRFNSLSRLADGTGFAIEADFEDERGWFVDSLWSVKPTIEVAAPER